MPGSLNCSTIDLVHWKNSLCGGRPVHCRVLSSILAPTHEIPELWQLKMSPDIAKYLLRGGVIALGENNWSILMLEYALYLLLKNKFKCAPWFHWPSLQYWNGRGWSFAHIWRWLQPRASEKDSRGLSSDFWEVFRFFFQIISRSEDCES